MATGIAPTPKKLNRYSAVCNVPSQHHMLQNLTEYKAFHMFYSCVGRWSLMMPVSGRYERQAGTAEPNVVLPPGLSRITPSHRTTMVVKQSPIGAHRSGLFQA